MINCQVSVISICLYRIVYNSVLESSSKTRNRIFGTLKQISQLLQPVA